MKKIITLITIALVSITTTAQQRYFDGVYSSDNYEVQYEIRHIAKRAKGESKKEYKARFERESERIKHNHYHHNRLGLPSAPNMCEFCKEEAEAIVAKQEKEREAAAAEKLRREEEKRREAEELQKRIEAKEARIAKEKDSLTVLITKIEKMRLEFWNSNTERIALANECKAALEKSKSKIASIEKRRFNELDALERQYIGRLNGEIFLTKKEAMDEKYTELISEEREKMEAMNYKMDKFFEDVKAKFNEKIKKTGLKFTGKISDDMYVQVEHFGGLREFYIFHYEKI